MSRGDALQGQSGRIGTMHFSGGKIQVLALGVFFYKGLISYVSHVTPLIIGNLSFVDFFLNLTLQPALDALRRLGQTTPLCRRSATNKRTYLSCPCPSQPAPMYSVITLRSQIKHCDPQYHCSLLRTMTRGSTSPLALLPFLIYQCPTIA